MDFYGYKGTVKKLYVSGSIHQISIGRAAGAIVGRNEGIIDNCVNNAAITVYNSNGTGATAGGICGNNLNYIKNCVNNGKVENCNASAGGITGASGSDVSKWVSNGNAGLSNKIKVEKCSNNADVTITNVVSEEGVIGVGGIVGHVTYDNILIEQCTNNSTVTITGVSYVGGICGYQAKGTIRTSTNKGTVIATSSIAGGIAGITHGEISSCKNTGNITSQGSPSDQVTTQGTGGIAGRIANGVIQTSSNTGNITATMGFFAGGIVGLGEQGITISQCFNYNGNISVNCNGVAGIIGRCHGGTVIDCYNYFTSNDYYIKANGVNCGGIVGVIPIKSTSKTVIQNCYNIGSNIINDINKGDFIGECSYETELTNVYTLNTTPLDMWGVATVIPTVTNVYAKSEQLFKTTATNTSSVAYLLNGNSSSGVWRQSSSINNGYPYLLNNVP